MPYQHLDISVPAEKRQVLNEHILSLVDSGNLQGITADEIFNCYTGNGGLHGLDRSEYDNYHEYSEAKKEIEQGQFFTPAPLAERIATMLQLKSTEVVADLTSGAGAFFNYFNPSQVYGCEIDAQACKIAHFLYPEANIQNCDLCFYEPQTRFDFIVGNPPFNLKWKVRGKKVLSQDFYFEKAAELLRPAGLLLAIIPASFGADELFNKTQIEKLDEAYNTLCQVQLPANSFAAIGVTSFDTKLIVLQRKCGAHLPDQPYKNEFANWEQAATIVLQGIEKYRSLRVKANNLLTGDRHFNDRVLKYLYEIKTHAALKPRYAKAYAYVEKFRTQKCPGNMNHKTWYDTQRITDKEVLSYLKRTVRKQSRVEKDLIRLVKTSYGLHYKAYSAKIRLQLKERYPVRNWSFNDIVLQDIPVTDLPPLSKGLTRLVEKKKKAYLAQSLAFNEVEPTISIEGYLAGFWWLKDKQLCFFNNIQKTDLGKVLTKSFSLLNWQQGSGKTPAAYAWSLYRPMKKVFVVSNALSINMTWAPFLQVNNESFTLVRSYADLALMDKATFVLISHEMLLRYKRYIKRYVHSLSYKASLVVDESDEMTNNASQRTRATLDCFRKLPRKLLTTGTTTRNNIAELYSQFELMYNNSVNFICECETVYLEDRETKTIYERDNSGYFNKPFPPFYGNSLFKFCFNPAKTTVFGIKQHNQDIYNEVQLRALIEKTIITRKFREIAGDKYEVSSIVIQQTPQERALYRKILAEFERLYRAYFADTGSSRKEAMLRVMRQIKLLIDATSMPQYFKEYEGNGEPNKTAWIRKTVGELDQKICIGTITKKAVDWYAQQLRDTFPFRPLFVIKGEVSFGKRRKIIDQFEQTTNGILVCTQQSLRNSISIPTCDEVIMEALQWNIPKMEQFYFRFIRYDSANLTRVRFITYEYTIENNLLALLMAKEKLNDYVKTLEYRQNSDIYGEFDIDPGILHQLIEKQKDEEGHIQLRWGNAAVA